MTLTDSNKILKMEDNDKERLHNEIVQNEFAFAKSLANELPGGKENIALKKEITEEVIKNFKSLFEEWPEK